MRGITLALVAMSGCTTIHAVGAGDEDTFYVVAQKSAFGLSGKSYVARCTVGVSRVACERLLTSTEAGTLGPKSSPHGSFARVGASGVDRVPRVRDAVGPGEELRLPREAELPPPRQVRPPSDAEDFVVLAKIYGMLGRQWPADEVAARDVVAVKSLLSRGRSGAEIIRMVVIEARRSEASMAEPVHELMSRVDTLADFSFE